MKLISFSVSCGIFASVIGFITFVLSWNFYEYWGGPIPGYDILLFPGNLSLVYIWHPIFTEEINLYPKLGLILLGQCVFVTLAVGITGYLVNRLSN